MTFVIDEITREACDFASATTLNLTGELLYHKRFRDMFRRDGTPVQSGDTTSVGVAQANAGRAICRATLILGAQDQLVLDAGKVYKSTAGASLPAFSPVGAAGEVYCAAPVDFFQMFDDAGNLLNPDLIRAATYPEKIVADFLSELGTVDKEAVLALGVNAAFDTLAGFFAMDTSSPLASAAADGEDIFQNDHTATGRVRRLSLKPWPTKRGDNIATGNALTLFAASTAGRLHLVLAWDATGAHYAMAMVLGHATDPILVPIFEFGSIGFEVAGTSINLRNNSGGAITVSHIKPVIG